VPRIQQHWRIAVGNFRRWCVDFSWLVTCNHSKLLNTLGRYLVYCLLRERAFQKAITNRGESLMAGQGRHVSADNIQRIICLLATTEMTITEIAMRMSIHKSTISAINRKFSVRRYNGLRSSWPAQGIVKKQPEESEAAQMKPKPAA
jgi:hypothetical protein